MIIKNILFFFAILLCLVKTTHAQDLGPVKMDTPQLLAEAPILPDVGPHQKTHPEKIIFSQIKLAGGQPNLDTFSKSSPLVLKAQDIDKNAMAMSEYNRIGNSFNMHDQKSQIVVQTTVEADEYSSLQDMIVFDEFDETTFFQFKAYGYQVGIVPESAETFSQLALSKLSAERFFRILGSKRNVMAEFILKPVYADGKDPLIYTNGDKIWLMFARVGEFRLWSTGDNPELLWYHRASWYAPQDNKNIQGLFEKP